MKSQRVSSGDLLAALGAIFTLVGLFALDWYKVGTGKIAPLRIDSNLFAQVGFPSLPSVPANKIGAWDGQGLLGTLGNLVIVAAAVFALVLILARLGGTVVRVSRELRLLVAGAAVVVVVLRMIFPVEKVKGYSFNASLEVGIFVTLAGTLLLLIGEYLIPQEPGTVQRPPG